MRQLGTNLVSRARRVGIFSAVACVGALSAFPSGASAAAGGGGSDAKICHGDVPAGGAKGQSCSPASTGGKAAGGGVDVPETIAQQVANMAGQKVAGFIFAQVGLDGLVNGPQANFDAVKAQLEGISRQLTELQSSVDSISSQLARIELNQYTQPMNKAVTTINTVYVKFNNSVKRLIPYADEERAAVAAGQTCDDVKACVKLRATYTDYLHDEFLKAENGEAIQEANRVIHDNLVPNPQGGSGPIAFGR